MRLDLSLSLTRRGAAAAGNAHEYWRIYVTEGVASTNTSIAEVEMRATTGGADQCTGGTATANEELGVDYTAAKAFDNDNATIWHTSTSVLPNWIAYQFASPVEVEEVAITSRNEANSSTAPEDFSIQYSDDGTNWTTYWSVTGQIGWSANEQRVFTNA